MSGERGKRLFNGLLVANIGKYIVKNSQLCAIISGNLQTRLRHQRKQTGSL